MSVVVAGAPEYWRAHVRVSTGVTIRELLAAVHDMLQWPLSYAELSRLTTSVSRRTHVLQRCAARCRAEGQECAGAESLTRIDWLEGSTRLRNVEARMAGQDVVLVLVLVQ